LAAAVIVHVAIFARAHALTSPVLVVVRHEVRVAHDIVFVDRFVVVGIELCLTGRLFFSLLLFTE